MNSLLPALVLATTSLASAATLPADPAASPPGAERNDAWASDLLVRWCDGSVNTVFSPHSLSAAMAMIAAGARGETARQIAACLRMGADAAGLPGRFAALDADLVAARKAGQVELAVANSLWPQQEFAFRPDYLELLRTRFRGEARPVDYAGRTEAARQAINQWVAERTANRIRDLIAPGVLSTATRMTLANAVYFKGAWSRPFDPQRTAPAPFFAADGREWPAPLMSQKGKFRYAGVDGIQALELPYAGDGLAMVVLLPEKGQSVRRAAEALQKRGLAAWTDAMTPREVSVFLPKFTFAFERSCADTFRSMGIVDAFDAGRADLSGMAGKPGDLVVSAVLHKAFIEVGEEGTEAAAATAGVIAITSFVPPQPPVVFRADHPFVFLIRERKTGCILFAGAVVRPD